MLLDNGVNQVVIVGGGTAGWMTAAALSNFLGPDYLNISVVESDAIGTVGVGEATIPSIMHFIHALNLDQDELMRETNATFKLGIEFINWRKLGHTYFHHFGKFGVDMKGIGFSHYWLRRQKQGRALPYSDFNIETQAAGAARFMRINPSKGSPRTVPFHSGNSEQKETYDINYAFHIDAKLLARYLRRFSEMRGVKRIEGKVVDAYQENSNAHIKQLRLEDGRLVDGDFFIDCSGFQGLLIEQIYKAGYEDWSRWLPVNQAVAVPSTSAGDLLPYTRSTAHGAGWQWRIPLQHRLGNGYVFCDEYISEDEATEALLTNLDGKTIADPKVLRFVTGRRRKSWIGNCVAIGLSSGFLEPLESTSIHLIQVAIAKLLAMFPKDIFCNRVIDRYNSEMSYAYDNIKDFIVAHYKLTEREDSAFWRYVRHMEIPESLKEKLEIFRVRGEVMAKKAELFKETNWFAVLIGQGFVPESYHPLADVIYDRELDQRIELIRTSIEETLQRMPSHEEFIRTHCASSGATN